MLPLSDKIGSKVTFHCINNWQIARDSSEIIYLIFQPMPPIEQNGPGFQYILQFKREGQPESTVQRIPINTWSTSFYKYSTPNQLYEPYQITLRARNMLGEAQQDPPTIRGFTGESGIVYFLVVLFVLLSCRCCIKKTS